MINSSGDRIRGKIAPFKKVLDQVFIDATTNNGIEIFREYLKDAIALRMLYVTSKPIDITDSCIEIIRSCFGTNEYSFSFVNCSLQYYSNKKEHKIEELDFSGASCMSRDSYKSVRHAQMDCLQCNRYYVDKIINKISKSNNKEMIEKCKAIKISVKFVSKYIGAMQQEKLPKKITQQTYDKIVKNDDKISTLYSYNKAGGYYSLVESNLTYKSVKLETATEIFCSKFDVNI